MSTRTITPVMVPKNIADSGSMTFIGTVVVLNPRIVPASKAFRLGTNLGCFRSRQSVRVIDGSTFGTVFITNKRLPFRPSTIVLMFRPRILIIRLVVAKDIVSSFYSSNIPALLVVLAVVFLNPSTLFVLMMAITLSLMLPISFTLS